MQLGMIGLGRMGSTMACRLLRAGHACVEHDVYARAAQALAADGAAAAASVRRWSPSFVRRAPSG